MGTLTADVERLPGFCDHKLPTSCRLTSIPECCACADERAHAPSYSTYIDGVGFVPRGTRWQRYCWFCKEFWENRIAATDLRPSQTRIPEAPDQSDFLQKWYEFHRGYRTVIKDDGSEERIAVLGEPFGDVSPGCLPRTLDELRAGRERSQADERQHIQMPDAVEDTQPSLDAELDQMFEDAAAEEALARRPIVSPQETAIATRVAGQAMQAASSRNREYQNRRIAALRRELYRMRNGIERVISGLRDLGEIVPDPTEATGRLENLGRTLDMLNDVGGASQPSTAISERESPAPAVGGVYRDPSLTSIRQRLVVAQDHLEQAQRFREQSSQELNAAQATYNEARRTREEAVEVLDGAELDLADHRAQMSQLRREQRTAENYYRVFGTREEMDAAGSEYVSPIGSMFTRAWDRFRVAEEVRREERTLRQILEDEQRAPGEDDTLVTNTEHENQLEEYYAMLRLQDRTPADQTEASVPSNRLEHLLRNTPEPERTAIIARMRENGTAQVLEQPAPHAPRSSRGPSSYPLRPPQVLTGRYAHVAALLSQRRSVAAEARALRESLSDGSIEDDDTPQGLDTEHSGRPEPKEEDDMTIKLDCKVCYTQLADTACLPCGHLIMCQWCSEQHSPAMQHDRTRPRIPANCPVCRKRIKQKVRIYRP